LAAKDIQDFYTYEFNENHVTANTVIHFHANVRKALQYAVRTANIYAHLDKGTKDRSAAAMLNTGIDFSSNRMNPVHLKLK